VKMAVDNRIEDGVDYNDTLSDNEKQR